MLYQLIDELEEVMEGGGKIVDFHSCGIFPERWFDLVLVLRAETNVLYPRMEKRWVLFHVSLGAKKNAYADKVFFFFFW